MKNMQKIISLILILTLIAINIMSLIIENKVYATQSISTDIEAIDGLRYQGIKDRIKQLKNEYPNWNFKILYTGLDWNEVISNEYSGHGGSPKNLVYKNSTYQGEWICAICGDRPYDNGSWRCASEQAIKYIMDPRNSLNSSDIFQFEELSNPGCDRNTLNMMTNGTFLAGHEQEIVNVANNKNINAYYIVARLIQEQGRDGSVLVKGEGYNGQYIGYYNAFNVAASGNTNEEIIMNGLAYDSKKGWDTLEKSIEGGINLLANNYIAKGQNTLYLQKFDVEATEGLYCHQYMQNLTAARSEGSTLRDAYTKIDSIASSHTFIIPVYENMPNEACKMPNSNGTSNVTGDIVRVNVEKELRIRNAPNGGTTVGWLYKDEIVTRLEKASSKVNGTYWDKVQKANGVVGYAARETYENEGKYKLYLIPLNENKPDNPDINHGNDDKTGTIPNNTSKVKVDTENNILYVTPDAQAKHILEAYDGKIKITRANGDFLDSENESLATGYKVDDRYTVVKKGDCNGDGDVNTGDTYMLKCVILEIKQFDNEYYKKAADINEDNSLDTGDTFILKKQILGISNIEL